ncbi:MAG: replicative DNA helicase [Treponema sp.]|nr:replicative DNA helicase [Spirochaetia bacterium]MDY2839085.1 replicative DNA helicase [Treponema sp.]MDY5123564.1 replicative DNA helicase [Treponema sp.]
MDETLKDKVPPHNVDAEQSVLGALLLNWDAMGIVISLLRPDRFYLLQNQVIYEALTKLFSKNVRGDTISLINELTEEGKLEQAGGAAYIASLTDKVPSSANIEYYANIILDRSTRRELIKMSAELKADCYEFKTKSKDLLDKAEQKIFSLAEKNETTTIYSAKEMMFKEIEIIEARFQSKNPFTGIPTGFAKLDTYTAGFQNSELIIIGARPSIGKTALALSMMENIVVEKNIPCGFFSLEMPMESIGLRLLAMTSRVPMSKIRSGMLKVDDVKRIQDAAGRWFEKPFYTVDVPNMRLMDLRAMARRMVANKGVKIIFIDYIGLITTEDTSAPVYEQVSEISKSLKALARELNIPIVALCQVARDAEGQEPNLAQLRGSGSIEQDADVVMFLHRDRLKEEVVTQEAKLILAKQRNGATGDVPIMYIPSYTKFENQSSED